MATAKAEQSPGTLTVIQALDERTAIYRPDLLTYEEGGILNVTLNDVVCPLKITDVAPKDRPLSVLIAYLDPRQPKILENGAREIAERIAALDSDIMVTPSSDKSEDMMRRARTLIEDMTGKPMKLLILKRGAPDKMQREKYDAAFSVTYSPITARGQERVMVVMPEQLRTLQEAMQDGLRIARVDDVFSTGQTFDAMGKILEYTAGTLGLRQLEDVPLVAVMRECDADGEGNLVVLPARGLHTAIITPVVVHRRKIS